MKLNVLVQLVLKTISISTFLKVATQSDRFSLKFPKVCRIQMVFSSRWYNMRVEFICAILAVLVIDESFCQVQDMLVASLEKNLQNEESVRIFLSNIHNIVHKYSKVYDNIDKDYWASTEDWIPKFTLSKCSLSFQHFSETKCFSSLIIYWHIQLTFEFNKNNWQNNWCFIKLLLFFIIKSSEDWNFYIQYNFHVHVLENENCLLISRNSKWSKYNRKLFSFQSTEKDVNENENRFLIFRNY